MPARRTVGVARADIPARLVGGDAVSVESEGLDLVVGLDVEALEEADPGSDPGAQWVAIWDEDLDSYRRRSLTGLASSEVVTDDILWTQEGTGAVPRSIGDKLDEIYSVEDFGAVGDGVTNDTAAIYLATASVSALGGGVLKFPAGVWNYSYTLPTETNVIWEFDGPLLNRGKLGGGLTVNYRQATFGRLAGNHPTTRTSLVNVTALAEGSLANGLPNADVAHEVRCDKINWTDTSLALAGEIDGQFIHCRQGGPTTGVKSACGGQCIDVGMTEGTGFLAHYEHISSVYDATQTVVKQIDIQAGVLNSRDDDYYGVIYNNLLGTMDACIYIKNETGISDWGDCFRNQENGIINYKIGSDGKVTWKNDNTGNTEISASIIAGELIFKTGAGAEIFSVTQTGIGDTPLVGDVTAVAAPRSLRRVVEVWESSVAIVFGDVRHNTTNVYRCTNGGGTTSGTAPSHGSGVATGADGIQWLFLYAGTSVVNIELANPGVRLKHVVQHEILQAPGTFVKEFTGTGSPEGVVTAGVGSRFFRSDGGPGTTFYVKESGTGATGWAAK